MPCNMSKNIIVFALAPSAMAQCLVRTATRSQSELSSLAILSWVASPGVAGSSRSFHAIDHEQLNWDVTYV
jgi:hypothetical protein